MKYLNTSYTLPLILDDARFRVAIDKFYEDHFNNLTVPGQNADLALGMQKTVVEAIKQHNQAIKSIERRLRIFSGLTLITFTLTYILTIVITAYEEIKNV